MRRPLPDTAVVAKSGRGFGREVREDEREGSCEATRSPFGGKLDLRNTGTAVAERKDQESQRVESPVR